MVVSLHGIYDFLVRKEHFFLSFILAREFENSFSPFFLAVDDDDEFAQKRKKQVAIQTNLRLHNTHAHPTTSPHNQNYIFDNVWQGS